MTLATPDGFEVSFGLTRQQLTVFDAAVEALERGGPDIQSAAAVVVRLIRGLMESFDSQDSSASPKESTPFIRITCPGGKQRQGSITTDNAKESHAYQR